MSNQLLAKAITFIRPSKIKKGSTNAMILFLIFSNIIGNVLTIISGLLVAGWIVPAELGTFNSFTLISGYLVLSQLGIGGALNRELPFYIGKGKREEVNKYAAVSQLWLKTLGFGILGVAVVIATYFFFLQNYKYAAGILVIGVTTWDGIYVKKYLFMLFRTNRDFNKLSWVRLINSFVSFASIYFVFLYGFYGLCVRIIIITITDYIFLYSWRPIKVKPSWESRHFRELFKIGLPMFAVANVYGLWPLFQRTLILALGGPLALGLFSIANMVKGAMDTVTSSISTVIYPTMTAKWGEGASVEAIIKVTLRPFLLGLVLFSVALPFGWWLLPYFINHFLPNYSESIETSQWMLLAGLFSLFDVFSNLYNVIKDQVNRLKLYVSGVGAWAVTVLLLYSFKGFDLVIFPQGMIVGYFVMALINFFHIKRNWHLTA